MLSNKTKSTVRWRRFSGASYAAFQSLHREVNIGVLAVSMLASAGLKATAAPSASQAKVNVAEYPTAADASSGGDTLIFSLEDVEVLAARVPLTAIQAPRMVTVLTAADVAAAAVQSINDLLEYAVGIDVRQRGEGGVQTDLSMRGGTFDQITILLNGVNISSPHTGHLSADFPVSMQDVERIEVLEGPSARVFGTSAFTGVVNIVTRSEADAGTIHVMGGDYGTWGGDLRLSKLHTAGTAADGSVATFTHHLSGGYSRSDGATPNSDYKATRGFYQGRYASADATVDVQLGYSYKAFGANTFYGVASQNQWESNERYMAAVTGKAQTGHIHWNPLIYWNRWFDHYQWIKDSPFGENFHQVDTYGASLNSWVSSRWGKTSLGVEIRNEGIYSSKLGNLMDEDEWMPTGGHDGKDSIYYKYQDNRTNISAFVEHDILLAQWTISLGVLANLNTGLDNHTRFYPGIDIAYRPTSAWKLLASWNMALRMPTFTDLYYSGVGIEGNSNLKPERTNDVSIGAVYRVTGWRIAMNVYYSHKSNMIDWVVLASDTTNTYHSGNFKLDNFGGSLQADLYPQELYSQCPIRKIGIQYAYINQDASYDAEIEKSKTSFEYLRHKVVAQVESRIYRSLSASLSWRWQERTGQNNRPYNLTDFRLSWDADGWQIYADCTNLFDTKYCDFSFIPQPGRWFKAGFVWKFEL